MTNSKKNSNQNYLSKKNSEYWNEICGSAAAREWKINMKNKNALKIFDKAYFDFYPYLLKYLPLTKMKNKKILEIGPGYGSVAQKIMSIKKTKYISIDVANGPIQIIKKRAKRIDKKVYAFKGDILDIENLNKNSFDYVIAIGSLHHSGNLKLAINKCYDLLKKNGQLIGMVYSAFSYRRWFYNLYETLKFLNNVEETIYELSNLQKGFYDKDSKGNSPPSTEFSSKSRIIKLCNKFNHVHTNYENITNIGLLSKFFGNSARNAMLKSIFTKYFGLDLYFRAIK